MKGRNEIRLNTATMIAAIQHYLDTVMLKNSNVEVINLFEVPDGSQFVIDVVEKVPPK